MEGRYCGTVTLGDAIASVMSKAKDYAKTAALGCILCGGDAEVHHLVGLKYRAHGKKAEKWIPLCPRHHRHGGLGVAVHAGVMTWEANFGTQEELWEKTQALLNGSGAVE